MSPDDERSRRARARSAWKGALLQLGDTPDQELVALPPPELIGLVTDLTLAAWAIAGEAIPAYDRRSAPGRVVRSAVPT